jgi:serine/threonine protein kinase
MLRASGSEPRARTGALMVGRFPPLRPEDPRQVASYMLRARLGSGGMGNVYLSFSPGGYPLAIKVVRQAFADDPEFRGRFRREVAAAQRVQGYYTAPVRDAAPDDEIPWYATAYIAGPSLQAAVAEYGPFPAFSVCRLLAGAAEGIAAVHAAGLIHRDLKPGNVLLAEDGPRVIDFGLAQVDGYSRLTTTGVAIGTPAYMAPEQVRGYVSAASDVFALGHLALFAATGHNAFSEGHTDALFYRLLNEPPDLTGCPDELRGLVARCLAKNPADRPSVGEVTAYASAAMRGHSMRLVDRAWLPQPVAESLDDYSAGRAPLPEPFADPVTSVPRSHRAEAPPVPLSRLLRPVIMVPAALLIAAGAVLGFVAGQTHAASAAAPAPPSASPLSSSAGLSIAPPANVPPETVAPAGETSAPATASTRPTAPATAPGAGGTAPADGYTKAYAGSAFTMPGGNCATVNPSDVVLAGAQPFVDTQIDGSDGDMEINCAAAPELTFSDTVAAVTGAPGLAGCLHALASAPVIEPASYRQLHPGSQFCLTTVSAASKKTWVMLATLRSLNQVSDDLAWTATAWYRAR